VYYDSLFPPACTPPVEGLQYGRDLVDIDVEGVLASTRGEGDCERILLGKVLYMQFPVAIRRIEVV
jgi:hypothetical protein